MTTRECTSARQLFLRRLRDEWLAVKNSLEADSTFYDRIDPSWNVRTRKNAYRQLRIRQLEFVEMAAAIPKVKDPYRYIERLFARLDARDPDARSYPMVAGQWVPI